jgi:hypothetical protein
MTYVPNRRDIRRQERHYWDHFDKGTNARRTVHRRIWPNLDISEETSDPALCEGKPWRRLEEERR